MALTARRLSTQDLKPALESGLSASRADRHPGKQEVSDPKGVLDHSEDDWDQ